MAKKKKEEVKIKIIAPEDIEVNCVYRTHVKDLVKVLSIDEERKVIHYYNITGSHKQWTEFKYVNFITKLY